MATLAFVPYETSQSGKVGTLCVKEAVSSYSEPTQYIHYWPVAEANLNYAQEMFPELNSPVLLHDLGQGSYQFLRGMGNYSPVIRLKDGGSTKPIKTDVAVIPAPKVRKGTEIRYRNGVWEKYLKSSGWTIA